MKFNPSKREWLTTLLPLGLFVLLTYLQRDWVVSAPGQYGLKAIKTIYVLNPIIYNGLMLLGACTALGLFIYSCKMRFKQAPSYKVLLILLAIIVYPASCSKSVIQNLASWTLHSNISTADGQRYYFLDYSFLQGQLMAIGKRVDNNPFIYQFEVLVMNNGDSPRSYSRIIRHKNAQNTYGQLYYSPAGYLIGVRYDNKCFLAYDLKTNTAIGHYDVELLSPFILHEKSSILHEEDVRSILEVGIGDAMGEPRLKAVTTGLNHPNPAVRKVAGKLMEKQKQTQKNDKLEDEKPILYPPSQPKVESSCNVEAQQLSNTKQPT